MRLALILQGPRVNVRQKHQPSCKIDINVKQRTKFEWKKKDMMGRAAEVVCECEHLFEESPPALLIHLFTRTCNN